VGETKRVSLGERLRGKLEKIGFHPRKASELSKGLVPTVAKVKPGTKIGEKLRARLAVLGLTERKAKEVAKSLTPVASAALKARAKLGTEAPSKTAKKAADLPATTTAVAEVFKLRLDEGVMSFTGRDGDVSVGRVMHGLSSTRSYIVVAVKGEHGLIGVRQLGADTFNVKFYPTMRYWATNEPALRALGAEMFLARSWYERMHFPATGVTTLLNQFAKEAKRGSGWAFVDKIAYRFQVTVFAPVRKAFRILYGYEEDPLITSETPTKSLNA
jgi:hypothetical protein